MISCEAQASDEDRPLIEELASDDDRLPIHVGMTVEQAERVLLLATLRRHRGCKRDAARQLGINRKTIYEKLRRYAAAGDDAPAGI